MNPSFEVFQTISRLIPANGQKLLNCSREPIVPIKSTIDLFPRTDKMKNTDLTSR